MAIILDNQPVGEGFFLLTAKHPNAARMGQFYMVRAWERYPVLSRPISVYDADAQTVTFLYKVVGKGTQILSGRRAGEEISLEGPCGNGFPALAGKGRIALVGGGVGIAPLYLAAKTYQEAGARVSLFLGFSTEPVLERAFGEVADQLAVRVGGFVTDAVDTCAYDAMVACGPTAMMEALYRKCEAQGSKVPLYVSLENRMACGIGTCLVCSCKTAHGNKRVCKDGPVFLGSEVFGIA